MLQCRYTICLLVVIGSLAIIANGQNLQVEAITQAAATSQLEDKHENLPRGLLATPDSINDEQAPENIVADAAMINPLPTTPPNDTQDAATVTKATSTQDNTEAAATETEKTNPPAADNKTDEPSAICAGATTCENCKAAAQSVETALQEMSTCVFKGDEKGATSGCQLIPKKEAPTALAEMCLKQQSSQKETQNSEDDDSGRGGFSFVVGLFVLTVASVAFYRFKKGKMGFGGDAIVNDFASVMSGTRAPYHKSETAPLASTSRDDDEEWGWEDSTHNSLGHLEMSSKKDDEDLTRAFAMSTKGLSHSAPKSSPVFSRAPPVGTTSSTGNNSAASGSMSSFTPSAMQITSLGVPTSSSTMPKKKQNKNQEDDLFASMGLAAKPTFSATTSSSTTTKAPLSKKSSDLVATDLMSVDAKWDDDGDLDDLLDD